MQNDKSKGKNLHFEWICLELRNQDLRFSCQDCHALACQALAGRSLAMTPFLLSLGGARFPAYASEQAPQSRGDNKIAPP